LLFFFCFLLVLGTMIFKCCTAVLVNRLLWLLSITWWPVGWGGPWRVGSVAFEY
jgi:hypothetical protein